MKAILVLILTIFSNYFVFSQDTTKVISKEQYKLYEEISIAKTTIFDTLTTITPKQKNQIQDLLYKSYVANHFKKEKLDSIEIELNKLKSEIAIEEATTLKSIRDLYDDSQKEELKKAMRVYRQEKQNEQFSRSSKNKIESRNRKANR